MGLLSRSKNTKSANGTLPEGNVNAAIQVSPDREKEAGLYDDTPVKFLTGWSLAMGLLVSMGGFIFGYDTGTCPQCNNKAGITIAESPLQDKSRASWL